MNERASLCESLARDAAERIQYDLTGRAGFDEWWESVPPDVRDDIVDAWAELIAATFNGAVKA